jgi:hypothetical protein
MAPGCAAPTLTERTLAFTTHPETQRFRIAVLKGPAEDRTDELVAHPDDYDVVVMAAVEPALEAAIGGSFPYFYRSPYRIWDQKYIRKSHMGVYSKHPFIELEIPPQPPANHEALFIVASNDGKKTCALNFSCPANFSAKGYETWPPENSGMPGLVRVSHRGRIYNIVFGDLDGDLGLAEEEPRAYDRGLGLAAAHALLQQSVPSAFTDPDQEIIFAGNTEIESWTGAPAFAGSPLENPSAALLGTEYGQTIWGELDGAPFFDAWRTTSPEDDGVTDQDPHARLYGDNPSYVDIPRGMDARQRRNHVLLFGGGYYAPRAPVVANPTFLAGPHDHRCPQGARRLERRAQILPDRTEAGLLGGLVVELGPRGEACRADMAIRPAFPAGGTFLHRPKIDEPGQVVWYRVDAPGTYSVGLEQGAASDFAADVFAAHDLSRPLANVVTDGTKVVALESACAAIGAETCAFDTKTYLFTDHQPFYIRVSSPSGKVTGRPGLLVRRHDCSSEDAKCWLLPGDEARASGTDPDQRVFYYAFATHKAFDGAAQTFEIDLDITPVIGATDHVTLTSTNRGTVVPETRLKGPWLRSFQERKEDRYLLRIHRTGTTPHTVQWRTNLTYVFGATAPYGFAAKKPVFLSLYCTDETEGDTLGDDEIKLEVGQGTNVHYARFWDTVDAYAAPKPFEDMPPLAVVGDATITLSELSVEHDSNDPADVDQRARITVGGLDPRVREKLGMTFHTPLHTIRPDGSLDTSTSWGAYQVTLNLAHSLGGGTP